MILSKRAQMFGQIFIYVIALVIISFVLVFGYKAIFTFKDKADQVSFIQFRDSFSNAVETLSLEFGSVRVKEFITPDGIIEVCFVTNFPELPELSGTGYPLIEDSVNSGAEKNIFLVEDTVTESFTASPIQVEEGMECFGTVNSKVTIRMEGKGNHVTLSQLN